MAVGLADNGLAPPPCPPSLRTSRRSCTGSVQDPFVDHVHVQPRVRLQDDGRMATAGQAQ
jgi:hypothetical protein